MFSEVEHLRIPLEDIKSATDNFAKTNRISEEEGRFWKVYKGQLSLSQGNTMTKGVTVKRFRKVDKRPEFRELWEQIVTLSHENLVSLVGFCEEDGERILVYEYLSNRSLDLYLSSTHLSWNQRLRICIGAARGINYLHHPPVNTQSIVLHCDIKTSNISLDQNWNAKIADFGLSKFGPDRQGFVIPEPIGTTTYVEIGMLTKEPDVYSFGVVLFQLLCGRQQDNRFAEWVRKRYEENKLDTIVKTSIKEQISPNCLETFSRIAYQCLGRERDRPSMTEIVLQLEIALKYQEAYDKEKKELTGPKEESDLDDEGDDSDDEDDFWETKLPQDWKGMITKFNIPRAIYTIKRDLFSLLHKGILFDEGNQFLWINNDGAKCVLISAKRFLELNEGNDHRWEFQHGSSRFPVVAEYLYGKWHEIRCQIKTSILSLGTMYAANLVFKYSKKPNEDLKHLKLMTIRWKAEGLSVYSTHNAELTYDNWYKIRMWNFFNQGPYADFDIGIEELSYYDNPVESGLLIQGIEFQPIEMVWPKEIERMKSLLTIDEEDTDDDLYWEKKLPNDYQQYIEISDKSLHYTSKQELYFLLCRGFLAYGGKLCLSLCKSTGGICTILPATDILRKDTSYQRLETLSLSESRFRGVKELGTDDWYVFTCRLRPFMFSPNYIYTCYLVFKFGDNPRPNNPESWTGSTGLRGIHKSLGLPFKSKLSGMRFSPLRQKNKNKFGDNEHVLSNNARLFKAEYKLGDTIHGTVIAHMNSTPPINIPTIMPKNDYGSSNLPSIGMPKGHMDLQNSWMEERNDGWMEVRLSKSLHQLEKHLSLEIKLWKPPT